MPYRKVKLTPKEQDFYTALIEHEGDTKAAAKSAGISPSTYFEMLKRPVISDAVQKIQTLTQQKASGLGIELVRESTDYIRSVVQDTSLPHTARLKAADMALKYFKPKEEARGAKSPDQMTAEELQSFIDDIRSEQARRATPVIEHEETPDPFA